MTDMFEESANFSHISKEPLKVGKVLQKAFIEVNEEGSEAAAVTGEFLPSNLLLPPFIISLAWCWCIFFFFFIISLHVNFIGCWWFLTMRFY